jgi:hypothetical protein
MACIGAAFSALGVIAETSGYRDVFAVASLCCAAALATVVLSPGPVLRPVEQPNDAAKQAAKSP